MPARPVRGPAAPVDRSSADDPISVDATNAFRFNTLAFTSPAVPAAFLNPPLADALAQDALHPLLQSDGFDTPPPGTWVSALFGQGERFDEGTYTLEPVELAR